MEQIKPVVLKEIMAATGAKMNYYSCTSIDLKNQFNLLCRNNKEDKMKRVRPEDHLKAHGSLNTDFAKTTSGFAFKWY